MTDIVALLTRASLALSVAIALVLVLRLPGRRFFGARMAYALWLIPVFAAAASMLPARRTAETMTTTTPVTSISRAASHVGTLTIGQWTSASNDAARSPSSLLIAVWIAGVVTSLGVLAQRQRRLLTALGPLRRAADAHVTVFYSDAIAVGPALVGAWRPRIVLPQDFASRFTPGEQALVIAHELVHLRTGDAQVNATVALLRALQWFNPLVYVASRLIRLDQELACDATVVARHPRARRRYAEAMVKAQIASDALPLGCGWTTRGLHPLSTRIAMLQRRVPGRVRRRTGAAVATSLMVLASYTAWAAQPTRSGTSDRSTAHERVGNPAPRNLVRTPRSIDAGTILLGALQSAAGRPLLDAVQENDTGEVGALIAAGANVDAYSPGDGTPLVVAARGGNLAIVRLLLEHGADPNLAAPGDGNPLIMSSARGHADIVTTLVQRGADVNGYVPGDETPLINAASKGHLAIVRYLVEQGADVNLSFDVPSSRGTVEHRSPLGQATKFGHRDVVDYLRAAGATP